MNIVYVLIIYIYGFMYAHVFACTYNIMGASQGVLVVKNPSTSAEDLTDMSSIPGLGRSPGEGHGNPLQYLPRESPWTTVFRRLQSLASQRVRHA